MRTVLLCVLAFTGCAEPPAPVVEEPIAVAIQKPPRHPPMTEAEREQYVNCADPLIRAFARREIDVGTRIEVVLARFPKFVEIRHDPFVTLEEAEFLFHSCMTLIAKNGKLITALGVTQLGHWVSFWSP
jgi:hypothetical protein